MWYDTLSVQGNKIVTKTYLSQNLANVLLTATGTTNQISVTSGQNPVFSLSTFWNTYLVNGL